MLIGIPHALTLRYFCVYSARRVGGGHTWGLYTAALTARADYKTDYSAKNGKNKNGKKAKHSMAITTENEKTDLHVSEDGSQPAQDDSLHHKGRPPRLW